MPRKLRTPCTASLASEVTDAQLPAQREAIFSTVPPSAMATADNSAGADAHLLQPSVDEGRSITVEEA